MPRGFDDVPDQGGFDSVRLDELFDLLEPAKEAKGAAIQLRLTPQSILPIKTHWIEIRTKKGVTSIPRICVQFNPDNQSEPLEGRSCPYCKLDHTKDTGVARASIHYYANAIDRDAQANEPNRKSKPTPEEQKTGFKSINSKTWTPDRVVQLPPGVTRKLKDMRESNQVKTNKGVTTFPVNHEKYGVDISIKYNPKASGEAKYTVEKVERTPMTEEETGYLIWNLDDWEELYDKIGRLDTKSAIKDLKSLKLAKGDITESDEDEDGDDGEDGYSPRRAPKKPSRRPREDEEDEEEEEEEAPPRRKKPAGRRSDTSDSSDDDAPRRKKPAGRRSDTSDDDEPPRRTKKTSRFADEDDDEDDAPAPRRKKTSRFADEDDDEDDEPPRRKKTSRFADDDEDDEPPRRTKSRTQAKQEPDFDDDIPF